jgi:sulfur carrier protein ThiS
MKVWVNLKPVELPEGAKFSSVVELVEEVQREEPMFKHHKEKSAKTVLLFVVNGKVVPPEHYDFLKLNEGDQIRWFMPYAGG